MKDGINKRNKYKKKKTQNKNNKLISQKKITKQMLSIVTKNNSKPTK
jgi:hypothetical protein